MDLCEKNNEININLSNNTSEYIGLDNVSDEVLKQKKLATIRIISDINKRYKRKKKKLFK